MSLKELIRVLQEKMEEVDIWQSLIDDGFFHGNKKLTPAMENAAKKIKLFAKQQINLLEQKEEQSIAIGCDEKEDEFGPVDLTDVKQDIFKPKSKSQDKRLKIQKPNPHKERKQKAEEQPQGFPFKVGQLVNIVTTQSLTAVNAKQMESFVPEDKVKVLSMWIDKGGLELAEILKQTRDSAMKAIISIEDLEQ